jgi:two-component system, OmpR family, sensor histidine kinase BaeS
MTVLKRSLVIKMSLAFWLVSISGIVIIALLAGRVSQQEFNRFVNDAQYQGLVDNLAKYYSEHGSFAGADYLLVAAQQGARLGQAHEYMVVDPDGNVLLSLVQRQTFGRPYPDLVNIGIPIIIDGAMVARLIPLRLPRSPADLVVDNLRRIYNNIFIGAVFATLFALILGWLMARNIIRPLRELNTATEAITQGDLEKQVNIPAKDEIGHLAESFNTMTASLKRSRDLRRQMVADIAHELRNPLSIILGHAEALSEGVLPPDPETLDIIYDEARHLSRLVDDLRTLSLSEAGELLLQRSSTDSEEILERCSAAYAARAAEKGVTIRTECAPHSPQLDVDVERIVQVLFNLLDNSLKHTPSGGSIQISAAAAVGAVEISVQDTGSGIPPEDLPFIFDRFYRGNQSRARIQDGSGLGLAISKALVEQHGGKISVSSAPGQGTRMTIHLPVVKESA